MNQRPPVLDKVIISYPERSIAFPVLTIFRDTRVPSYFPPPEFLTAYPDAPYTALSLTENVNIDDSGLYAKHVYEKLPGPIYVEASTYRETGIPILVSRQRIARTDVYQEGEIAPVSKNISSISVASNGVCTVTLTSNHDGMCPRLWVHFAGTNSTPSLDGDYRVVDVPAPNQVTIAVNVTVAGTAAGTMIAKNHFVREIKATNNPNVNVKIESSVGVADVSSLNEIDVPCTKDYAFPDFLQGIDIYSELASSESDSTGVTYAFTIDYSWGSAPLIRVQNGYRGPCEAKRSRYYFSGPPPSTFMADLGLEPTIIMPSSGTITLQEGSVMHAEISSPSELTVRIGFSYRYRTMPIPAVLTGDRSGTTTSGSHPIVPIGGGQGGAFIDLIPSVPTHFTKGDIIVVVEQPQKLDAGLWTVYAFKITVPYTSGENP